MGDDLTMDSEGTAICGTCSVTGEPMPGGISVWLNNEYQAITLDDNVTEADIITKTADLTNLLDIKPSNVWDKVDVDTMRDYCLNKPGVDANHERDQIGGAVFGTVGGITSAIAIGKGLAGRRRRLLRRLQQR